MERKGMKGLRRACSEGKEGEATCERGRERLDEGEGKKERRKVRMTGRKKR